MQAQTELRLWPGKAPGSEQWSIPESITRSPSGDRVITNVSEPTLTVFLPDAGVATGAAAVIAPGGALRALGFDNKGVKVAEWLNERGIAGFVLKYRTLQQDPSAPRGPFPACRARRAAPGARIVNANANPAPNDAALGKELELAVADAQAALAAHPQTRSRVEGRPCARRNHRLFGRRRVAVGTALAEKSDAYPDFLMSMYGPSLHGRGTCPRTHRHCSSPSAPRIST